MLRMLLKQHQNWDITNNSIQGNSNQTASVQNTLNIKFFHSSGRQIFSWEHFVYAGAIAKATKINEITTFLRTYAITWLQMFI